MKSQRMAGESHRSKSQEEAYELGRKAYVKGASGDTNPFPADDPCHNDWAHGFLDGQKIRSDDCVPGRPRN
jgi:hypothetical protein